MGPYQPHHRDAGLRRVSRTTAWLSAGALAMVGVFSAYVGRALPGASRTTSPASVVTPTVPTQAPVATTPASGGAVAVPTAPPATSPPRVVVPVQPHTRSRGS
jgi:hypothetical protein